MYNNNLIYFPCPRITLTVVSPQHYYLVSPSLPQSILYFMLFIIKSDTTIRYPLPKCTHSHHLHVYYLVKKQTF